MLGYSHLNDRFESLRSDINGPPSPPLLNANKDLLLLANKANRSGDLPMKMSGLERYDLV